MQRLHRVRRHPRPEIQSQDRRHGVTFISSFPETLAPQLSFYGYDGFDSVRVLTDQTGAVTDTYDYDAWGNVVNSTGPTPNNYLYRGEQYDPDLGLYYLRARYFNPVTGRFLTRDPAKDQPLLPRTLHKYLYAAADPVNVKDPTGRTGEYAQILGRLTIPEVIAVAGTTALVIGCWGEPIVAGTAMVMAAALGYEIYNVHASGTCPAILTFDWREQAATLPPPAPYIPSPGHCTDSQHEWLETLKYWACLKADKKCNASDIRPVLAAKMLAKEACLGARLQVMIQCFEGGDENHQDFFFNLVEELEDCVAFAKGK
jgi:RHS repeat-associated protein